jgi:hypothetical protein
MLPESNVIPLYSVNTIGLVVKYSAYDSIEWVQTVLMRAQDIAVDDEGNYFVCAMY